MNFCCKKSASKVLNILTAELNEENRSRKIDNTSGSFMPVSVEFLYPDAANGGDVFSVAHYYEQNGDLMRDPEMTFLRVKNPLSETAGGLFYYIPMSFRQDGLGIYRDYWVSDEAGKFERVNASLLRDAVVFCTLWMRNIQAQQSIL
jgi:hypothetical protein